MELRSCKSNFQSAFYKINLFGIIGYFIPTIS